ncbi:MAG: NAD(P)/FAD-dependent oxidoreductase [Desulfatiglandales bacterium]
MINTKYLLIGSGHAALSAIDGIRMQDEKGPILMTGAEGRSPYSPTILPYIIAGKKDASKTALKDEGFFKTRQVNFLEKDPVKALNSEMSRAYLESGKEVSYEKVLVATGAAPQVPSIPGLEECPYDVLRTMEDALKIREKAKKAQSAIIIGAGLIGMHLAEALISLGLKVTIVEALPHVLGAYFDEISSQMIRQSFEERGVKILLGCSISKAASGDGVCALSLQNGIDLSANMLIIATGVRPNTEILDKYVKKDKGILVDNLMKTSVDNVWAAGDVVQCKDFFEDKMVLNGILPNAAQQGLIAGRNMAGDKNVKPFKGSIAMNTFSFFGNKALSIGQVNNSTNNSDLKEDVILSSSSICYQKILYKEDRIRGVISINTQLDPGIFLRLISDQISISEQKNLLGVSSLKAGRLMMSARWR